MLGVALEAAGGRDACIFSYFSEASKLAHQTDIPLLVQLPPEFAQEPVTIGDHLRRRRLELGWYQIDVAVQIGVTASTIWNWEHGWTVDLKYIPRIIEFLGDNPIPRPADPLECLAWYKLVNGLTLEDPGAETNRDPEQLADWLSGRHKPYLKNQEKIGLFVSDRVQGQVGDRIIRTD